MKSMFDSKIFGSNIIQKKKNCRPNSSHKIGLIRNDCSLLINMSKILSTSNVRLFLTCRTSLQANIFYSSYHGVSNVGPIHHMVGPDTMLNYQLSKKLKLIGINKFNDLIINLTLIIMLSKIGAMIYTLYFCQIYLK